MHNNRGSAWAGFYMPMVALRSFLAPGGIAGEALLARTPASAMKIGIIGSGNIGGTVGELWVKAGHQVLFSSRNPEQLKPLVDKLGPLARAGTVKDALAFGDAILMAVPYGAIPQIGRDNPTEFAGKIVLDATNAVLNRDGEVAKEAREMGVGIHFGKILARRAYRARFEPDELSPPRQLTPTAPASAWRFPSVVMTPRR
jgi:hypothetical protein